MTDEQALILKAAFTTADGQKALEVIRELAGFKRGKFYISTNDRDQAYHLGKIDLVCEIEQGINQEIVRKSNVRRSKSESEY